MTVLVVGGGGREHAICRAIKNSKRVTRLLCAPGNGGISEIAECYPVKATDKDAMIALAKEQAVDMVMVAPDDPLAQGMVDALQNAGIRAFGPSAAAAEIESSKVFSKALMTKYGIPTAAYRSFNDAESAHSYIDEQGAPIVVKSDGLALGKGVQVSKTVEDAKAFVDELMLQGKFGASGARVVIEEYLTGPEVTMLCFTDGTTIVPMLSSQDHKRAYDGDKGANTGGMGAICPSPYYTPTIHERCMREIYEPTIRAMREEGRVFKGVLYFGLMLTTEGPKVIEYNARFGDPEAQAILPMLRSDITGIFDAVIDGRLAELEIEWESGASCCVVLVSGGYPEGYETGCEISGIESPMGTAYIYHAGTKKQDGRYFTAGGRVLGVSARAENLENAINSAYAAAKRISFRNMYMRGDIGRLRYML